VGGERPGRSRNEVGRLKEDKSRKIERGGAWYYLGVVGAICIHFLLNYF
jgi:hypothetical protein